MMPPRANAPTPGRGEPGRSGTVRGFACAPQRAALPETSRTGRCRRCSGDFSAECSQAKVLTLDCTFTLLLLGKDKMKCFDYLKKQ